MLKDTVNGFIEIAKSELTIGEEINIASCKEISVRDIFNELKAQINKDAFIVNDDIRMRPEKSEVDRLLGSNKKIMELTNWKPKYDLHNGLKETISWLKHNLEKYKTDIYNV